MVAALARDAPADSGTAGAAQETGSGDAEGLSRADGEVRTIGNGVGVPEALYKIVAWFHGDDFFARGYVIGQSATSFDLARYLVSIDEIEARTGLDFFSALEDGVEAGIEAKIPATMWGAF